MSNKPRKKKKTATPHSGPTDYFPFDNYKQFEKSMDDIILLLNTLPVNRIHDDELDIIENYIIQNFGITKYTEEKIREILVTLEAIAMAELYNKKQP
jgi:hypothetical protein